MHSAVLLLLVLSFVAVDAWTTIVVNYNFTCTLYKTFEWSLEVVEKDLLFHDHLGKKFGHEKGGRSAVGTHTVADTSDGEYGNEHYELEFIVKHSCNLRFSPSIPRGDLEYAECVFKNVARCPVTNELCTYDLVFDFDKINVPGKKRIELGGGDYCKLP